MAPGADEKYRVVAPETMQETFMSDSEDEGGKLFLSNYCMSTVVVKGITICINYTLHSALDVRQLHSKILD